MFVRLLISKYWCLLIDNLCTDVTREEKEMYYSIIAEMILAQPSSHPVTDNGSRCPSCACVKGGEEEEEHK